MRLIDERLSAEVLDHIKKWYAKCEEADCMPENGLTIGRLLDTIEALQQENERLKHNIDNLIKRNEEHVTARSKQRDRIKASCKEKRI